MFISPAWADEAASAAGAAAGAAAHGPPSVTDVVGPLVPFILIFFVFYVMVIRPQNKRMQDHRKEIDSLQKGDKVITGGGLVATVRKLQGDDEIELEIAPGVIVTAVRSTIMTIRESAAQKRAAQAAEVVKSVKG